MQRTFRKDPDEVEDYFIDWSDRLATSETISTSSWTVETGLNKDSSTNTNTVSTIWVSGGTHGESYEAVCTITTNQGRTKQETIIFLVGDN